MMKARIILIISVLTSTIAMRAQVGIHTTTPQASLDIVASLPSNPSNNDGLLIPRIDVFPATNPGANQQGMLVYLTTAVGSDLPGFYYWDNPTTTWINISGAVRTYLEDTDTDTKIQVEESADEDIIRFDMAGTEYFRMNSGRIETSNTGGSVIIGENTGVNDDYSNNRNVFIGSGTGTNTVGGAENIALGTNALKGNVSGSLNIAMGFNALDASNTGSNNIALGNQGLTKNTSGSFNVALGYKTLGENTTGSYSIGIGSSALNFATGSRNIGIGALTLYSNTSGSDNIAIGYQSGRYNTGSGNVFLGHQSGFNETGSNKLYIENSNSTTPLVYGDFNSNLLRVNGTLDVNNAYTFPTGDGASGQVLTTNGAGSVTWQSTSSKVMEDTDGDTKIYVEKNADEDKIRFDTAGAQAMIIDSEGDLGIGGNPNADASLHLKVNDVDKGFLVTGAIGTGTVPDLGSGSRMMFYPTKGAFRAGLATGNIWDDANVGRYSVALGYWPKASGFGSFAVGGLSNAEGYKSIAIGDAVNVYGDYGAVMGRHNNSHSFGELVVGLFATNYTPNSTSAWNASDRLFVVGDGQNGANRSNALTIYKDGRMNINDAYDMPMTDGNAGEVMTTDGSGTVSWSAPVGGAFEAISGVVQGNSSVNITSDDFVFGSTQLADDGNTNHDKRMFFDKSKGAFRAGQALSTEWDDANVGNYSIAAGYQNTASGNGSVAFGTQNTASGTGATVFGVFQNYATNTAATAWGTHNVLASGIASTAWGIGTRASGGYATAWGASEAAGIYATSWGEGTTAPSAFETSLGRYNTAYTPNSATAWDTADRLFTIGNGNSNTDRSNALTLIKNGDLGLGIDNPIAKMDIRPGDNNRGLYINHDKTTAGTTLGLQVDLDHTAGTSNTIYGALIDATKTGAMNNTVYGVYGRAYDNQTGTGTRTIYGVRGYSSVSSTNGTTNSRAIYGSTGGNGDNEFGGYFAGDVYTTGAYTPSDRTLKNNIQDYKGAIGKLGQLEVKSYDFKTSQYPLLNLPEGNQIGLISQNVAQVFPELVKRADETTQLMPRQEALDLKLPFKPTEDKEMVEVGKDVPILAVNYTGLVPVLIQATKEQQELIKKQQQKIEDLESRLKRIEALLSKEEK